MNIDFGNGKTKYVPGVSIDLTGDEVAEAISGWLISRGVHIEGPRTITVNGDLCREGYVYVDPSGSVVDHRGNIRKVYSGRGEKNG